MIKEELQDNLDLLKLGLTRIPYLKGITYKVALDFLLNSEIACFSKGEIAQKQRDLNSDKFVGIIKKGKAVAKLNSSKRIVILNFLQEGDVFGH